MPSVKLSIFAGVGWQFFDNNGNPLSGGKVYSYYAGTTTPLTTYTSSTGSVAHTNPIVLDAAGKVPSGGEIWLDYNEQYKFIVKSSTDVLLNTYDNIGGSFNTSPYTANFSGNGLATSFNLAVAPLSLSATSIYINGVYQQKNSYSLNSIAVIFSEAPPIGSTIEVVYI